MATRARLAKGLFVAALRPIRSDRHSRHVPPVGGPGIRALNTVWAPNHRRAKSFRGKGAGGEMGVSGRPRFESLRPTTH